jgi:hypothetical protein
VAKRKNCLSPVDACSKKPKDTKTHSVSELRRLENKKELLQHIWFFKKNVDGFNSKITSYQAFASF